MHSNLGMNAALLHTRVWIIIKRHICSLPLPKEFDYFTAVHNATKVECTGLHKRRCKTLFLHHFHRCCGESTVQNIPKTHSWISCIFFPRTRVQLLFFGWIYRLKLTFSSIQKVQTLDPYMFVYIILIKTVELQLIHAHKVSRAEDVDYIF